MNINRLEDICNKDLTINEIEKDIYTVLLEMDSSLEVNELKILTYLIVKDKACSIQAIFGLFGLKQIESTIQILEGLSDLEYLDIRIVDESTVFIDGKLDVGNELKTKIKDSIYPLPTREPVKPKRDSCMTKGHKPSKRTNLPLRALNKLNSTPFILDHSCCQEDERNPKLFTKMQLAMEKQHNLETERAVRLMSHKEFYFEWVYDHRGRMCPKGYHLNPHGTNHKKAMLELY